MESGVITDSKITASSQWDANHAAIQGRLNFKAGGGKQGGWSSRTNDVNQWIQVALPSYTKVSRVTTQGRNRVAQWVTKYKLQYSDDGLHFHYYHVPGQNSPKVYPLHKTINLFSIPLSNKFQFVSLKSNTCFVYIDLSSRNLMAIKIATPLFPTS